MFFRLLVWINFCVFIGLAQGLGAQSRIESHHEKLRRIRDEIQSMEKQLEASQKKESNELYVLANLDLEIDLTQSVVQNLKKEQQKRERQIAKLEDNLKTTQKELKHLKQTLAKRLIYMYKYGRVKDLELLLTADSINDGLLWVEYQQRLSEHDYRNYLKIQEKQAQIERNRDLLAIELEEKKKLLQDKLREEQKLKQKKQKRQTVLRSIRKNTELLRQQLTQKEQAAEEIRNMIVNLEREPAQKPMLPPETLFADLKGRMPWPTEGEIVTRFGRVKHPELKTVTENIGIEIKSRLGSPVQVVASGKVTTITWQRGRGNIVIVSHYGGYYTVYTHLEQILVNLEEEVEMGQVIGTVGESGSLSGPILHFEIWQGTEKLNPELWLGKST